MSWEDIQVDDYGWEGKLTVKEDGTALDISGYTTLSFIFKDPNGQATEKTAAFDTDGTDGVLVYTIEEGLIDQTGLWRVAARVAKTGVELTTEKLAFTVESRPD